MTGRKVAPCGTLAAYRRHLRNNEPVDDACRNANSAYQRNWRAETGWTRARHRALARLADVYRDSYERFLKEELAEASKENEARDGKADAR